jgi:DeoR family transcriptional regulator, copper-sensing transcriptional repressor
MRINDKIQFILSFILLGFKYGEETCMEKKLTPRQREILRLVAEKGDLKVGEIQQTFDIAQATVYREIQKLEEMKLVVKIPGGVSRMEFSSKGCAQCGRENNPRTVFFFEHQNGEKFSACCSHCGLIALAKRTDIITAMTTDFLYGTMLNARLAWYVLDSVVCLCCRPSILSFSNQDDASRFVQGFGGQVFDFSSAQTKIKEMMAFRMKMQ